MTNVETTLRFKNQNKLKVCPKIKNESKSTSFSLIYKGRSKKLLVLKKKKRHLFSEYKSNLTTKM
jgi:hypothetical protein